MEDKEEKSIPQFLYHYYKVTEHTEAIFTKNEIYFNSPLKYNDPFDSDFRIVFDGTNIEKRQYLQRESKERPDLFTKNLIEELLSSDTKQQQLIEYMNNTDVHKSFRKGLGVYCLSEKKDDILMWAHYADSHKGFCIEFTTNHFGLVFPVIYDNNMPELNIVNKETEDPKELLTKKARDWKYENEWRAFLDTPGKTVFSSQNLTGVIFGCRITPENKIKIINWCYKRNPKPQLYNAIPKQTEYGLDIVPFDYSA